MDTLEALRYAAAQRQRIVSVVNSPVEYRPGVGRGAQDKPGPEIVRVDKSLHDTADCARLLCLALAKARGAIDPEREAQLTVALAEVPGRASEILHHNDRIAEIARDVSEARDVLYLGRGTSYPIALEGALKLRKFPISTPKLMRRNETYLSRSLTRMCLSS